MPSSARKSGISSARRSAQRAYVPYSGDSLQVGKRTGVQIPLIKRRSDGFESFEELLREADKRTPPKVKGIRKSKVPLQQPVFDDADGEMSMDIGDSPMRLLSSARILSTPTLRNTSGLRLCHSNRRLDHAHVQSISSFTPQRKNKPPKEVRSSSPRVPLAAARTARSLPPASRNRQPMKLKKRALSAKV